MVTGTAARRKREISNSGTRDRKSVSAGFSPVLSEKSYWISPSAQMWGISVLV